MARPAAIGLGQPHCRIVTGVEQGHCDEIYYSLALPSSWGKMCVWVFLTPYFVIPPPHIQGPALPSAENLARRCGSVIAEGVGVE